MTNKTEPVVLSEDCTKNHHAMCYLHQLISPSYCECLCHKPQSEWQQPNRTARRHGK